MVDPINLAKDAPCKLRCPVFTPLSHTHTLLFSVYHHQLLLVFLPAKSLVWLPALDLRLGWLAIYSIQICFFLLQSLKTICELCVLFYT